MKIIKLYHKISPLGLNYLGITTKENPHTYMGSGKRWKLHIKKHNLCHKDIVTIVLFESCNMEEIREKGIYYSNLYDIVESKNWANLIPETGEGCFKAKLTEEHRKKIVKALLNRPPVSKTTREKISAANKGRVFTKETKDKISKSKMGLVSYYPSKETKDKISLSKIGKTKKGVTVVSLNGEETFNSVRELAKFLNVNEITLSANLRRKSDKYPYKYLDDYIPPFRKGCKGKVVSEETKLKLRESRQLKKVMHIETKEIFNSVLEASIAFNIKEDTLRGSITNKRKNCKFQYYE